MVNKIRKCAYSEEEFEQKRSNQIYASAYNRITYNNKKNSELLKYVKVENKKLLRNYKIVVELIKDKQEIIYPSEYLKGKGFIFNRLTHILEQGNTTIYGIYNFAFYKIDNNQTKIIKL